MIVTCTACQTRFRVSGDKIGPKGARIRCGRCHAIFVIAPEAQGDITAAPPHVAAASASLPRPPPLPKGSERMGAPASEAPAGYPGAPDLLADAGILEDPFTPAAPPRAAPPFDHDLFAPVEEPPDPFAPTYAGVVPSRQDHPGESDGEDPFGLVEPHSNPVRSPAATSPRSMGAATDLTELLDGSGRTGPGDDTGSLALEERDASPVTSATATFEQAGMDPGLGGLDLVGPEDPDTGEVLGLAALEPDRSDRGDPRRGLEGRSAQEGDVAAERTAPALPASRQPDPRSSTPAPAPVPVATPAPPAAAGSGGRLVAALTNSLSLALLIAIAVALFLAWRGGLAARSPFSRKPPVEAFGVRGGLYDTATGPSVLVVRGQVSARAAVSVPVRVRVELVEDGRVVATAMGLAGATATPEQVFGAGAPDEAAALRRTLDGRAASSLAAGATVPFLVVFPPPSPDPRWLELRASAEPAPEVAR